jgi:mannose-6-phosphate isomerase-like protein (cupin superfamily)
MGYQTASISDVDSVMDREWGGMWFLEDPLETDHLGVTVLELEPGATGKEHDHAEDGQEEVYVVVHGAVDVDLDGETVSLTQDQAIRVDPEQRRQLHNRGDRPAKLVLVGGPLE